MIDIDALTLHMSTLIAARNERSVLRDEYVDLSEVADIIKDYMALPLADDPYVHSATILRIACVDEFWQSKNPDRFVTRVARTVISTFLEIETLKIGDFNTPDECLEEIFAEGYLDLFRDELKYVPVIRTVNESGAEILVPDLFAVTFLARAFGTIAETSREIAAREEKRLFFPNEETNMGISLVDISDMSGDDYELSEFDEWATDIEFDWDETFEE